MFAILSRWRVYGHYLMVGSYDTYDDAKKDFDALTHRTHNATRFFLVEVKEEKNGEFNG